MVGVVAKAFVALALQRLLELLQTFLFVVVLILLEIHPYVLNVYFGVSVLLQLLYILLKHLRHLYENHHSQAFLKLENLRMKQVLKYEHFRQKKTKSNTKNARI